MVMRINDIALAPTEIAERALDPSWGRIERGTIPCADTADTDVTHPRSPRPSLREQ